MQVQFLKLILPAFLFVLAVVFILITGIGNLSQRQISRPYSDQTGGTFERPTVLQSVTAKITNFSKQFDPTSDNLARYIWDVKIEKTTIELDFREFETVALSDVEVVVQVDGTNIVTKTNSIGAARIIILGKFDKTPSFSVVEVKDLDCTNCPLNYTL